MLVVTTGEVVQEGPENPSLGLIFGTIIGGEVIQGLPGYPVSRGFGLPWVGPAYLVPPVSLSPTCGICLLTRVPGWFFTTPHIHFYSPFKVPNFGKYLLSRVKGCLTHFGCCQDNIKVLVAVTLSPAVICLLTHGPPCCTSVHSLIYTTRAGSFDIYCYIIRLFGSETCAP